MLITDGIEPHTDNWIAARLGKITASNYHKVASNGRSKTEMLSVGGLTYVDKKIGEILTQTLSEDVPEVDDVQRGLAGEQFALEDYTELTGIEVYPSKLYQYNAIAVGTTDGQTSKDKKTIHGVIEVKCPRPHIHQKILGVDAAIELKAINAQYYNQPQANILFTGAEHADFLSYNEAILDPDLRLRIIRIYPDLSWQKDFFDRITWIADYMSKQFEKFKLVHSRNLQFRKDNTEEQILKLQQAIENIQNINQ